MEAKHLARAWMLSALALIPVAAGIGWWSGRASITSSSEPADASSAVPDAVPDAVVTTSSPGSRAPLATAGQPLPDLSAPLRTILPELKRRADGGEPGAACRLAAEMELCEDIRRRLDEAATNLNLQGSWGGPLSAKQQDMRRNMQQREAERSERLLQESTHCEGVPAFSSRERVHYWRSAAMGGSLAAINYYVMGRPFRPENTLADLDALRQFQHEAATIAERGVASGDIQTTIALAEAYSPLSRRRSLLSQAVSPNASKSLALWLQTQSLLDQPPPGGRPQGHLFASGITELEKTMDAATLRLAREQASAYRREAPTPALVTTPRSGNTMASGGPEVLQREFCSR
ncbi:MAG: hypothetical protein C0521_10620 [Xanthomonas sp.]|nr:hypothetical protein [Xanthomonas sp.]